MAITGAMVALLGAGVTTSIVYGDEISAGIAAKSDYDAAIDIMAGHNLRVFQSRNLANGLILNSNSVQQYRDLNITSIEEVYVHKYESKFKISDNFDEEMDKLINSVSYYDADGKICFYNSFQDFLTINGYNTEDEFKDAAKASILAKYRAGEIKEHFYEGWGVNNVSSGRKGK